MAAMATAAMLRAWQRLQCQHSSLEAGAGEQRGVGHPQQHCARWVRRGKPCHVAALQAAAARPPVLTGRVVARLVPQLLAARVQSGDPALLQAVRVHQHQVCLVGVWDGGGARGQARGRIVPE